MSSQQQAKCNSLNNGCGGAVIIYVASNFAALSSGVAVHTEWSMPVKRVNQQH
jgi:hypothetical protein